MAQAAISAISLISVTSQAIAAFRSWMEDETKSSLTSRLTPSSTTQVNCILNHVEILLQFKQICSGKIGANSTPAEEESALRALYLFACWEQRLPSHGHVSNDQIGEAWQHYRYFVDFLDNGGVDSIQELGLTVRYITNGSRLEFVFLLSCCANLPTTSLVEELSDFPVVREAINGYLPTDILTVKSSKLKDGILQSTIQNTQGKYMSVANGEIVWSSEGSAWRVAKMESGLLTLSHDDKYLAVSRDRSDEYSLYSRLCLADCGSDIFWLACDADMSQKSLELAEHLEQVCKLEMRMALGMLCGYPSAGVLGMGALGGLCLQSAAYVILGASVLSTIGVVAGLGYMCHRWTKLEKLGIAEYKQAHGGRHGISSVGKPILRTGTIEANAGMSVLQIKHV